MSAITISRQYASGGSSIARLVADKLGWTLIDNEFVDQVAARAGISRQEVEQREERVPTLIERLARALAVSSPEVFVAAGEPPAVVAPEDRLVEITERVIQEAAQHGDVVLVGRGAQAYLAERANTLHAYIVAPRDVRVRAAAERHGIDIKEAEKMVGDTDAGRKRYVKTHYGRDWDDPSAYHLALNSDVLGYEGCAEVIVAAAAAKLGVTT